MKLLISLLVLSIEATSCDPADPSGCLDTHFCENNVCTAKECVSDGGCESIFSTVPSSTPYCVNWRCQSDPPPYFATSDTGSECINGWTYVSSTQSCSLPADITNEISCSTESMTIKLKPSLVYDDHTLIPSTTLSTMTIDIRGDENSVGYSTFITFDGDDTEKTATKAWADLPPYLSKEGSDIIMAYKFKVSSPSLSWNSNTVFTTRHANEFFIRCKLPSTFDVATATAIEMDTLELGAAQNGTSASAIDTSSLFTLKTYTDGSYGTESSTFELGLPVYTKIDFAEVAKLPTSITWAANECKAQGDGGLDEMPIYQSDGTCKNPYLAVTVDNYGSSSRTFNFNAFTFDGNSVNDMITITCGITLGYGNEVISDSTACAQPMI